MCPCCSRSATWTKPSSSGGCLKGKGKVCAPRFKKSGTRPSIRFTRNAFRVEGKTPGLTRWGPFPSPGAATCRQSPAVRLSSRIALVATAPALWWRWSVLNRSPAARQWALTWAWHPSPSPVTAKKIAPAKFLSSACQGLRRLQRSLSRKVKGSNNHAKEGFRLAKAHAKVADKRLDHLHKLATGPSVKTKRLCWKI